MWYATVNGTKNKNHIIIPKDMEKAFDEIQWTFMIKTLNKLEKERNDLNIIKTIHDKPTAKVILNSNKLKAFLLRPGTKQRCLSPPCVFSTLLETLDKVKYKVNRQEKEIKAHRPECKEGNRRCLQMTWSYTYIKT